MADLVVTDLIVTDEDYESMSTAYTELQTYFDEILSEYISIIEGVCTDGVTAGNLNENLLTIKELATDLSKQLDEIAVLGAFCTDYIEKIDEADEELF